jgi:hypothetical protein
MVHVPSRKVHHKTSVQAHAFASSVLVTKKSQNCRSPYGALGRRPPRGSAPGFTQDFSGTSGPCHEPRASPSLWRSAGLQVPRRRPRRRVAAARPRRLPASGPNQVWAYDFVFDTCAHGAALKCLTVVDEFTRECLAIDVARSIRSARVIEVLTQLVSVHGAPKYLRSDNGPDFVARRSFAGCRPRRSNRHSSIQGSRGRTARTNRSTGSFATSV